MAISQRLDLKQSQSLVMTPQLQQAIKLLQMSNLELSTFVEGELEQNPLLERDEAGSGEESPAEAPATEVADAPDAGIEDAMPPDSLDRTNAESLPSAEDAPLDTDYENNWDSRDSGDDMGSLAFDAQRAGSGGRSDFGEIDGGLEATLSRATTLREHLQQQLAVDIADPGDRMIGLHLIEMLDEAGWISGDLGEVATILGCPLERVEAVLETVQGFDPPGIFARNLRECLALQLRDRNRLDPAMQALLDNLEMLARRDRAGLLRVCGVGVEDLTEMVAEIRALDPKPATAFEHEPAQPVTPDILMRPHADGGWQVELNAETLPRVLVNRQYYSRISRDARDPKAQDYLSEQLNSANWLVKALHQRATTILKVASEIIRQQDAFFVHGIGQMRPLILRDIAAAISMHESTVSRVTSNKYMATPRGIYELKYFFNASLGSSDGGTAHASESVRHRIKAMCDAESPRAILSDDDITARLREEGIDIARRTVAKYREAMNIPSSVQRRRRKAEHL